MEWQRLITSKRLGQERLHPKRHDDRSEFKRDYDRLIFSAPFRRMQNKTQVFPLPGSVFVHNRLTHSLEVASVGMSLGTDIYNILQRKAQQAKGALPLWAHAQTGALKDIGQIVATACLAHDLGNPPFGHSGEKAIQTFFTEGKGAYLQEYVSPELWSDITRFEGNANAFRLLTHQFLGRRPGGMVMTYSTLAAVVKYPWESAALGIGRDDGDSLRPSKTKFGFFNSEKDLYRRIADEMGIRRLSDDDEPLRYARHPLVYLVEAADDICYEIMDIEDANKLKILTYEETAQLLLAFFTDEEQAGILDRIAEEQLADDNEKIAYLRACAVGKLESECVDVFVDNERAILSGTFRGSLIDNMGPLPREAYRNCMSVSAQKIYKSKPVLDVELSGYRIMETLLEQMTEAVAHPDRFYSRQLIDRVSSQYDIRAHDLGTRLMAVIDYISGMTDVYALDVYQKVSGISLPII